MESRYKISKVWLFVLTIPLVLLILPISLTSFFYTNEMTLERLIDLIPIYLMTLCYLFFVVTIFRFSLRGEIFELVNSEIRFTDGSVPLKLKHVTKINLINSVLPSLRAVHFEIKPEYRRLSFIHFPILSSIGGKTIINFGLIAGGQKTLCQFYNDVCNEHKKYMK